VLRIRIRMDIDQIGINSVEKADPDPVPAAKH
jgi:hypothetical protein